jgi:hypothetical protein
MATPRDAMTSNTAVPTGIPTPSRVEAAALAEAVRYLRRAGTQTATLLLLRAPDREDAGLLELLRDEFLACAVFCESMLELSARD